MFSPEKFVNIAVDFIRRKVKEMERDGVIFGISGGVDSACIAGICSLSLPKKRILGLLLPEKHSSPDTLGDSKAVAEKFGINTKIVDITSILEIIGSYKLVPAPLTKNRKLAENIIKWGYKSVPKSKKPFYRHLVGVKDFAFRGPTAYYRIKHRIRMVLLYYYAEQYNYLVVGTSNRTEALTGFFVKYGDSAADIMPIMSLYKEEVFKLAGYLNVPLKIIKKSPSPDLIPGITDELALGMKYSTIDKILKGIDADKEIKKIAKESNVKISDVKYVMALIEKSAHMRRYPFYIPRDEFI